MLFEPQLTNYNPDFDTYFRHLDDSDLFDQFQLNTSYIVDLFGKFIEFGREAEEYSYAPGKWTVKDILHHINDTERVFQYRAFVAARRDVGVLLSSFDQDFYMEHSDTSLRSLEDLLEEFRVIRQSAYYLMHALDSESFNAVKIVAGYDFTARLALAFMVGHGIHHCRVLEERYLAHWLL